MKESAWVKEKNQELLQQIGALREHAYGEGAPWSVSLKMVEEEIQKTLEHLVSLLESREEEIESLRARWHEEKEKLRVTHASEKSQLEEKIKQREARIEEVEKTRDDEIFRLKERLSLKETELEQLKHYQELQPRKKRRFIRFVFWATILISFSIGTWWILKTQVFWKVQNYNLPQGHPSAFGIIGNQVLLSDWLTQSLYFHRLDKKLSLSKVIFIPKFHFSGLTGDGERILGCDKWQQKILTLSLTNTELQIVGSISSPGPTPSGLFLDGYTIWTTDTKLKKIYHHRLDGDQGIIKEYATPQIRPVGVFRRGDYLWVLDGITGRVVRTRLGADLGLGKNWEVMTKGFPQNGPQPISIGADEKSLWVLTIRPPQLLRYNFRYLEQGPIPIPKAN